MTSLDCPPTRRLVTSGGSPTMPEGKAFPATLESWKQIAAYLNRSERTVRRWEADEGLPVHRHGHHKQDTVFARVDEIDRWVRQRTRKAPSTAIAAPSGSASPAATAMLPDGRAAANAYLAEHDAITRTIDCYIASGRAGDSDLMRPAFHPEATMAGYCQGIEYSGSIEHLFEWIDANGPAPDINPRFARIEIFETIAIVHLEVQGWSGKLAGTDARISEVFTLLKRAGQWLITQKTFHWHDT
ncbi:MAG TPA: nuclear transport factor 2 family protein [Vicinamibacterales bacterium]|nr:nuclear transport factor 2 family protein [Vicinamibacterales bacterium]